MCGIWCVAFVACVYYEWCAWWCVSSGPMLIQVGYRILIKIGSGVGSKCQNFDQTRFRVLVKVEVRIPNRILIKIRSGLVSMFGQNVDQNRIRLLATVGVRISTRILINIGSGSGS